MAQSSAEVALPGGTVRLVRGDITSAHVDAIVNAANSGLVGGAGVDGAIRLAGGPAIDRECRSIGGCPTGQAVPTTAGNLQAKHVIHAVAPVWRGGGQGEGDLLRSAYEAALEVADGLGDRSIAFPSLGTGIYGNPLEQSAEIALATVIETLPRLAGVRDVTFYLYSQSDFDVFARVLERLTEA